MGNKNLRNTKKIEKIAFIPARSGSTRLKHKNILTLKKKPLIYWTVKLAIQLNMFDKIIFSSDSNKYYKKLINSLKKSKLPVNNIIFDKRTRKESTKKVKIFDYIKNNLVEKFKFSKNDLIVQMLPTTPLRSIKTLREVINYSIKTKKNIFTISEYNFHISFALKLNKNGSWTSIFNISPLINGKTQSQSQKKFLTKSNL